MGTCCTTGKSAMPDNTTTRNTTAKHHVHGSDSDNDSDYAGSRSQTQSTDVDGGEELSRSLTADAKRNIISGFKDAVERGNDSLCEFLVQENPALNLLHTQFENGDSPLHVAVRNKEYRLILYLLDNDLSPNLQNPKNGDTPLHTAARVREVKCAALLFKYDVDVEITNNNHETALSIAAENKDEDIIELLAPHTQNLILQHITSNANPIQFDDTVEDLPGFDNWSSARLHTEMEDILANDNAPNSKQKHKGAPALEVLPADRPLEEKLDDRQLLTMKAIKIARKNPFTKVERRNTKKALEALQVMTLAAGQLPTLESWLEKKQHRAPHAWQKRWVMVKGSHFLWSAKQRSIENPKDPRQRAKFNGSFSLMMIISVQPVIKKAKDERQFVVTAKQGDKSKQRDYVFRAASKADRDFWVQSLNEYIKHTKLLVEYLGTAKF